KGRDKIKLALETQFVKTYFFDYPFGDDGTHVSAGIGRGGTGGGGVIFGISTESTESNEITDKYGNDIPWEYGDIMASHVAHQACSKAGLECVWDTEDYPVVNAVEESKGYNDTVANVLFSLISPLNQTEMYKVDIFIRNMTVFIKKREYPYPIDLLLAIDDISVKDFTLTKSSPNKTIKDIYVSRDEKIESTDMDEETDEDDDANTNRDSIWANPPLVETRIIETKNKNEDIIIREFVTTYTLNGILVKEESKIYKVAGLNVLGTGFAYELAEETIKNFTYAGGGPHSFYARLDFVEESKKIWTQQFRCLVENTVVEANHVLEYPDHIDSIVSQGVYLSEICNTLESYTYNANDGIIIQDNYEEQTKYDSAGVQTTKESDETIIAYEAISKDQIRVKTSSYHNGKFIMNVGPVTQSGQLPGPKKVSPTINISSIVEDGGQSGGGGTIPSSNDTTSFWFKKIEVHDTGMEVEFQENLFSRKLLNQTGQEMKDENLRKKYTMNMTLLPIPWIKKGDCVRFTGTIIDGQGRELNLTTLEDSDGNLIRFLITGKKYVYSRPEKQFLQIITAETWI
ncbi:MAG: hypothetical protein KKD44_28710, partial [Proteobacteria bacterium]|nr:hypothetical protein [Pseudomonadota bacterium]